MAWARWRSGATSEESNGYSFAACQTQPGCWGETGHPCEVCPHWELQLLPENERAGQAFLACQRQMKYDPWSGNCLGLDMPGVQAVLKMRDLELTPDDFMRLQVIESAYIEGRNEFLEQFREKPKAPAKETG